jgi:lincosamide nucleotidyltransferase B/F
MKQLLLERLEAIGRSLEQHPEALALIGLGSVGLEQERLDEHSDLDFFAIVEVGHKAGFIADLGWLTRVAEVAYCFQNTQDGFKLLYSDGVFCEFAVFDLAELEQSVFAAGRVVWKRAHIPESIATPHHAPKSKHPETDWLLGEALTNLLIGLKRLARGEKLSAARFIQQYALDKVLVLAARLEPAQAGFPDVFSPERRFEQRFPLTAAALPAMHQGYEHTPESALAILQFLENNFAVPEKLGLEIRQAALRLMAHSA